MRTTTAQLQSVVNAAVDLLRARQDQAVTSAEWIALAKAVAVCIKTDHRDLLTERDLEVARD